MVRSRGDYIHAQKHPYNASTIEKYVGHLVKIDTINGREYVGLITYIQGYQAFVRNKRKLTYPVYIDEILLIREIGVEP